jgi:hypothetical protein
VRRRGEVLGLGLCRLAVYVGGHYRLVVGAGVEPREQQLLLAVDHLRGPERLGGSSQSGNCDRPRPREAVLFREEVVRPHHQC